MLTKEEIVRYFKSLQDDICAALEKADGSGKFIEDQWDRPGGGGGRARVIHGEVLEKGGVNFSAVHGTLPEKITAKLGVATGDFFAAGVSIVQHPVSPEVPIIHMNVRYFEMSNGTWWFGGGIDLTPHYHEAEDEAFFHAQLKTVCDKHDVNYYPRFAPWADNYFYLKHRKETRGIGGIFFDRLGGQDGHDRASRFAFVKDVGEAFAPIYTHLIKKNKDKPYGDNEKKWQALRRGRYVEFNLVWDKGTKFGLDTDGRTESILMSMPPMANWVYNHTPEAGSREAQTLERLRRPVEVMPV